MLGTQTYNITQKNKTTLQAKFLHSLIVKASFSLNKSVATCMSPVFIKFVAIVRYN